MSITIAFPLGYKPVLKHGEHDQSSHGAWATGGAGVDISKDMDKLFFDEKGELNKDIQATIKTMDKADKTRGAKASDNALKLIAERQGFTGKPTTVETVEELETIQKAEGGVLVYRGVTNYSETLESSSGAELASTLNRIARENIPMESLPSTYTAEQSVTDFIEGEYFGGFGFFGNGTYTTTDRESAINYSGTFDPESGRLGKGKTMAMLIPATAKAPSSDVVKSVVKNMSYGPTPSHKNDIGRTLAAMGYQYYDAGFIQEDKAGIFVVLDRSMLKISKKGVGS